MMKLFLAVLIVHALSVSALVARRKNPAPYITSGEVRHCENLCVVRLQEGYTLEAHFEAIGTDLSQNASLFYPMAALNSYHARLDPSTVHELIRYDPGVVSVLHDYYDDGEPLAISGEEFEEIVEEASKGPKPSLPRRWSPKRISGAYWYNVMISAGTKLSTPLPEFGDRVSTRNDFQQ